MTEASGDSIIVRNGRPDTPAWVRRHSAGVTFGALALKPDPAARFILATAQAGATFLLTTDGKLLSWPGRMKRQDVRP